MNFWKLVLYFIMIPLEVGVITYCGYVIWDIWRIDREWKAEQLARKLYDDN